jgi:hypothetical protein
MFGTSHFQIPISNPSFVTAIKTKAMDYFRMDAMLYDILQKTSQCKISMERRWGSLQWHNVHIKFHKN